jgi:hypothetical protein
VSLNNVSHDDQSGILYTWILFSLELFWVMLDGYLQPKITYLDKYLDPVQGQDASVRVVMSKGRNILGPHPSRDAVHRDGTS